MELVETKDITESKIYYPDYGQFFGFGVEIKMDEITPELICKISGVPFDTENEDVEAMVEDFNNMDKRGLDPLNIHDEHLNLLKKGKYGTSEKFIGLEWPDEVNNDFCIPFGIFKRIEDADIFEHDFCNDDLEELQKILSEFKFDRQIYKMFIIGKE